MQQSLVAITRWSACVQSAGNLALRVNAVPEPSSMILTTFGSVCWLCDCGARMIARLLETPIAAAKVVLGDAFE